METVRQNTIEAHESGAMAFVGPDAVKVYQATVVASALRLYARTGIKANRSYTPANMMRVAADVTGQKFKARDYAGAAEALTAWASETAAQIHANNCKQEG